MIGRADDRPFLPDPDEVNVRLQATPSLDLSGLYIHIWRGSFPAIALNAAMDRDLFFSSYLQTYLQRNVRVLAKVGDEMAFLRFLRTTAARTGQLVNFADLARDADVAPNTAKSWLSILQASGIACLLPPWHTNIRELATYVHIPVNQLVTTAIAEKVSALAIEKHLNALAAKGSVQVFDSVMAKVMNCPPLPGGEPPKGGRTQGSPLQRHEL
jgi:uncharacterized protein